MFAVFENLQVFESRYEELNLKLYDPATAADRELYARLMKEHKEIEPIVETYRAWRQCGEDLSGAKELLEEAADRELKEMAQQEIREKGIELSRLEEELKLLLLPKDPNDGKNVIVEIRGGAGGEEAALFAYNLYRMYTAYAEGKGWKTEIVSLNETELGGFKEVSFLIDGEGAYSRLKYESGVHRVQRVPETEAQGRIHTSTATVAVLPEAEEVDVDIDPKDLQIDTFRSSGAGGQHINKTSSAIRVTHLPTGMVVECQDERSQYKNKDRAMKILRSKLYELEQEKRANELDELRGPKHEISFGNQIRNYVLYPYQMVKDLRSGVETGNVDAVFDGDIDEFVVGYHQWRVSEAG